MPPVGVDIIEIARIARTLARFRERFLNRIYTEAERQRYAGKVPSLAARFAAKEAVMKALGKGRRGIGWRDVEILSEASGKPAVFLYGRARHEAARQGVNRLSVSLSHSREYAVAFVVGEEE